ncbi:E3 ubiquitin-protein ligase FANCL isoform X2 [Numida meleagris]|uniref:E3 ubiquitin-protein ligase FANCL isoform X2 n=1 Tax=Numida meleagris TaxID=8996 RepID=UPI000B3E1B6C|nr:E3 ubiquitin-protein ligase FANCL isoform X2 [Numida meleagris]
MEINRRHYFRSNLRIIKLYGLFKTHFLGFPKYCKLLSAAGRRLRTLFDSFLQPRFLRTSRGGKERAALAEPPAGSCGGSASTAPRRRQGTPLHLARLRRLTGGASARVRTVAGRGGAAWRAGFPYSASVRCCCLRTGRGRPMRASSARRDFHIRILLPIDSQLKNARIECSWHLKKILHGYRHILKQRLHSCPDLVSFVVELKTILEIALKNTQELHVPWPPEYYSCLVRDLEILGWNKVAYVDTGLTTIKLKAEDSSGRQHLIALKLNAKNSLVDIHNQFLAALESLKEFWDTMDEIDGKTWVLEPENPTRCATARRIAIGTGRAAGRQDIKKETRDAFFSLLVWSGGGSLSQEKEGSNVSVSIEVDPRHPKMLPECYFLGADHVVNPLRTKLNNNMHLWDPEISLLQNLKDLLEIEFPSRAVLEKSDFTKDCGICYAYRLHGTTPDQVCDDPRCGQPFHQACLYEWLQGLPSSRQSFNVIFGECPYCNKPLTLKSSLKKP